MGDPEPETEQIRLKCIRKEGFFTVPPEHRVRSGGRSGWTHPRRPQGGAETLWALIVVLQRRGFRHGRERLSQSALRQAGKPAALRGAGQARSPAAGPLVKSRLRVSAPLVFSVAPGSPLSRSVDPWEALGAWPPPGCEGISLAPAWPALPFVPCYARVLCVAAPSLETREVKTRGVK